MFYFLFVRPNTKKKRHRPNSKTMNTPPPLPSVFLFAVRAGGRVLFFAVWAGSVLFVFCCLGGGRVYVFAVRAGCVFFVRMTFFCLLFGRGCVLFLFERRREFTHLPVCLARL